MSEYKRGTRVVVNEDLPGVPEGTPGKCGRGLGFAIKRYRVRFDNDVEVISVAHSKLVPEDEWPQFLARRARNEIEAAQERARIAEARAAAAESRGLPAASTDEPAAAATAPEADTTAPAEPPADDSDADPRLAAILARSKSAREATGVPAPESSPASAAESSANDAESSAADPTPAPADEPAAAAPPPAAAPARSAPPSGPERVEVPEFVPGPEVNPDYAPAANRVSELISEARKDG
ncbi:hypothetical protein [Candidatus Poriferisodalis sp.]|uniref:hypothetical protein n=1 Tax=Candidatus Poriferisodalis sp. TaxID=3101277 RepID=UPI003B01BC3E